MNLTATGSWTWALLVRHRHGDTLPENDEGEDFAFVVEAAGVSRRTWYRQQQRKSGTGCSIRYTVYKRNRRTCVTPHKPRRPKPPVLAYL